MLIFQSYVSLPEVHRPMTNWSIFVRFRDFWEWDIFQGCHVFLAHRWLNKLDQLQRDVEFQGERAGDRWVEMIAERRGEPAWI